MMLFLFILTRYEADKLLLNPACVSHELLCCYFAVRTHSTEEGAEKIRLKVDDEARMTTAIS